MIKILEIKDQLQTQLDQLSQQYTLKYKVTVSANFTLDAHVFVAKEHIKDVSQALSQYLNSPYAVNIAVHDLEDSQQPWFQSLLTRDENVNMGSHFRLGSVLQPQSSEMASDEMPLVAAFYSYKGGVGRTTTLVAYALHLASRGIKVAIIDSDMEAPGYLSFFDLANQREMAEGKRNGLVEYLCDTAFARDGKVGDVSRYVVMPDVDNKYSSVYNNILLVPGGNLNEPLVDQAAEASQSTGGNRRAYLEGLSRLDLGNSVTLTHGFAQLMRTLRTDYQIDVVLIDSRTGFNDIMGSVVLGMAQEVVGFFGFSAQTRPGLLQLIDAYYQPQASFGLTLVPAILPQKDEKTAEWLKACHQQLSERLYRSMMQYHREGGDERNQPSVYDLHRCPELERLGSGDAEAETAFATMAIEGTNADYVALFEHLDEGLGIDAILQQATQAPTVEDIKEEKAEAPEVQVEDCTTWRPLKLSKAVLKVLQTNLAKVKNFAEDCDFGVDQFFYRDCMAQIFDPSKFLIVGHKGTGKTYLYRALTEADEGKDEIRRFIRIRAHRDPDEKARFINVIPMGVDGSSALECLTTANLVSPTYDYRNLWLVLLWNALMNDPLFADVYAASGLNGKGFNPSGGNKALLQAQKIMEGGLESLVRIEDDLQAANELLSDKGIELSVMYDRLDSVVNPLYWGNVVSPLIAYWRENTGSFSNIHPKIFVRTDLFKRIEGANTARLKQTNVVDIDWTIGEVFGYMLKLIYSNPQGRACLWQIMRRVRGDAAEKLLNLYDKTLNAEDNAQQLAAADRASLSPLVSLLFGYEVKPQGTQGLGDPWTYFSRELANADGSVSLRPFINTLSDDVIRRALQSTEVHVQCVLSSDLYASRDVRDSAANGYFDDLASDRDFSSDLRWVRDYLRSDEGEPYRAKTLEEKQYNQLLRGVFERYATSMRAVRDTSELADLLQASGVIREDVRSGGKLYRFAPMYYYVWALQNTKYDTDVNPQSKPRPQYGSMCQGKMMEGGIILYDKATNTRYKVKYEDVSHIPLGTKVRFRIDREPRGTTSRHVMHPFTGQWYYYAAKVQVI